MENTVDNSAYTISSPTEEELLPPEEKQGIFLYILGTVVSVSVVVAVIVLTVLYFLSARSV